MKANIYWINWDAPGKLAIMPRPRAGDWLEDEMRSIRKDGATVLVSLLTSQEEDELGLTNEAEVVVRLGLKFFSFPIPDRSVPNDRSKFIAFAKSIHQLLLQSENIAIHCRMGIGRSAMLAVTLMALSGESIPEAFAMVGTARGHQVPDTDEQKQWIQGLFK